MDKLSNITAFTTVAETNSFAAAAKRLNIATSVVSKRIKDLEADLGTQLFNRSTRHVALTDAGYQYLEHTRRLMHELAEVEENIRFRNENPVGHLKVSAPVSFGTAFMGPAISSYLDKYPDVSINMTLTDLTVELGGNNFDVAIAVGDIPVMSAITRKLAQSRRVVVASPEYLAKYGCPQKPQDLSQHNCMAYSHQLDGRHWPFIVAGKKYLQPIRGRFAANNGVLLKEAALNHCGITTLPTFLVGREVMEGALDIILEEYEEPSLLIQAAWLQQKLLSARTRTFIEHMAQYFSSFSA